MIITDEAKSILEGYMANGEKDGLMVRLGSSCCGTSVFFTLTKFKPEDEPTSINGIQVLMGADTQERAMSVTLTATDGKLVIEDKEASACC